MSQVCDRYFWQCLVPLKKIVGTLLYEGLELRVHASKANTLICYTFSLRYVTTALNAMPLFFSKSLIFEL